MPPPTCLGCGGLQRDLIAVERLKSRAYVLRIFRCHSCRNSLRLVGPSGKETDSAYRRRQAALRRARLAARRPPRAKAESNPMTSEDAPPRSFRCPKLDCGAKYFTIEQEAPPVGKPKCLECGTPFLARTNERFVHYYPTRHIFD